MPRTVKASGLAAVCDWRAAELAPLLARHGLDRLFARYGIGAHAEEIFGEEPEARTHDGDVRIGDVHVESDAPGVYVLDGSLAVDGVLTFGSADVYTVLVITGDLRAKHVQQAGDTQLVVLGATKIAGLLRIDVTDAGFALFRGPVAARDLVIADNGVEADVPMFAKKPTGRRRHAHADAEHAADAWSAELLKRAGPRPDARALHAALVDELPLFAPDAAKPAKAGKPPTKAQLAKMSVDELLRAGGFSTVVVSDQRINPNYLVRGGPLRRLELVSDTYVAEFPETLTSVESLKLLGLRDGARVEAMLETVPRLVALTELCIVDCGLRTLPAAVERLPKLARLELRDNRALRGVPSKLAKLAGL